MVRLRTIDFADDFGWPQYGLLDSSPAGLRLWQHRNGDQHYSYRSLRALSRNDVGQNAIVRLAQPHNGRPGDPRRQSADGGTTHAAGRPLPWRTLLRHPSRRLGGYLDALLLGFWTSRSLYPDSP